MRQGRFIVIEGLDGSGKDTLISGLRQRLPGPLKVVQDPSPSACPAIRKILLEQEVSESARLYLFLAARSELLEKEIRPALQRGETVLCNRFILSTYAYQGLYFSEADIERAHRIGGIWQLPDLQLVLLSADSFRQNAPADVMDLYCQKNRQRIAKLYRRLAREARHHIHLMEVDSKTPAQVLEEATQRIQAHFGSEREI